ncbi:hypothetical protein DCC81_15760 [Chitinophaga parva]|uniref:Class I SAM-dependent methyltransferase n=1 Tax=Chitinophaga parva TaxID=2169414 RepID=A0A2T7BHF8_9BACT|nr:class I SAM-dependent methyltransferase [Chitinophaga parva]PUZ25721.1 hypothetical protein DCC81_15760 [Chitinophaga parva]
MVKSPITKQEAKLITTFPTDRIIEGYRIHEKVDVRRFFEGIDEIGLYQCQQTGYRFFHPSSIFGDGKFYEDLERENEAYYPKKKWEHQYVASQVKASEKVLEVGAGDGFFLEILRKRGIHATGLELNDKAIEAGRANGLDMHNELIQTHADVHAGEYDVLCAFQVLEHIYDVDDFLKACLKAVKKGGRVIFGVPNNNPYLYKHNKWDLLNLPPHHAGHWSPAAFRALPGYYDVHISKLIVERLHYKLGQYKIWYLAQRDYYLETKPWLGKLMSAVPRPLYKMLTAAVSPFIQGRNIIVIFTKTK